MTPDPPQASSSNNRWISALALTSTPRVGSSTISKLHFAANHRAMISFCWLPPDKLPATLSMFGAFTRIFSKAVGPTGHVFAATPPAAAGQPAPPVEAIAADAAYSNVRVVPMALTGATPADLVWTSQNYHDLHLARLNVDVAAFNRQVFNALRPGGLYVIVDHAAVAGAPVTIADTLHRIDPAIVRREVEAAGFQFVRQSDTLHNAADPHTIPVFDPAIRGHTDQFVLVFRRPN